MPHVQILTIAANPATTLNTSKRTTKASPCYKILRAKQPLLEHVTFLYRTWAIHPDEFVQKHKHKRGPAVPLPTRRQTRIVLLIFYPSSIRLSCLNAVLAQTCSQLLLNLILSNSTETSRPSTTFDPARNSASLLSFLFSIFSFWRCFCLEVLNTA